MKRDSYLLLGFQGIAHLSIIYMIFNASWIDYLQSFLVYFFTGCFGMTMTYHRLLSHKSWNCPRPFFYFGVFCGFFGLTGSPISWAAIHREHHRFTDTEKDPHAPSHLGFIKCQWFSMFSKPKIKYVVDLVKDPYLLFLHNNYFVIHLIVAVALLLLLGIKGLVVYYLFPAAILWNMGSFIITLSHIVGYRNFNVADSSRNSSLLGYLQWGEGWHNNHHAHPNSATFNFRWWELDIGGVFIRLMDNKCSQISSEEIISDGRRHQS